MNLFCKIKNLRIKRVFAVLMMVFIMAASFSVGVMADDTGIEFGQGYNNMAQTDGKVVAVLTAVFASMGIEGSYIAASSVDVSAPEAWSRKVLDATHTVNDDIYAFINENVDIEYDIDRNRTIMKFINGMSPVDIPLLDDLVVELFGEFALSGDPFQATIQSADCITVDGKDVIPWKTNLSSVSSGGIKTESIIKARGEFIVPFDGAYGTAYYTYETPAKPTFTYIKSNGTEGTITCKANFNSKTGETATLGTYRKIQYGSSQDVWVDSDSLKVLYAYMPALTSDGYFSMLTYAYIYSGNVKPTYWNDGQPYIILNNFASTNTKPQYKSTGNFDFTSQGVEPLDETDTVISVNGDTNNIVNNYFGGTLDPDASDGEPIGGNLPQWGNTFGTANPDGNGGFNLGFNMPDLNIDWNISGLKGKFPFSIPWDFIAFARVLNAEPETPTIRGTIPLGAWEWDIDFSLEQFDDLAALLRNLEFIGFCIGLIVATKSIIGG